MIYSKEELQSIKPNIGKKDSRRKKVLFNGKYITDASNVYNSHVTIKDIMGARVRNDRVYLSGTIPMWLEILRATQNSVTNLGGTLREEDFEMSVENLAEGLNNELSKIDGEINMNEIEEIEEEQEEMFESEVEDKINSIVVSSQNWGLSARGRAGLKAMRKRLQGSSLSSGMFTSIPITCRGEDCPYGETCPLVDTELQPLGEPCPVELSEVLYALEGYDEEFNFNDCGRVDQVHISEIIACDIMCMRAKKNLQKLDEPIEEVVTNYSEDGTPIIEKQISKYIELEEIYNKKRERLYNNMLATRKDKKGTGEETADQLSLLLQEIREDNFIVETRPDKFKEDDVINISEEEMSQDELLDAYLDEESGL